ncbi:hypothetical protein BCR43DRAFT_528328 [Syncephalastrum racemosum]|uniref:Uncharacterized protein n=1 Tax=Syncephalastrum racemosum TaxID=13706 RepID=A0A1X2H0W9_SYNRA|nr:hypothetical protein BCR43DRAFT_528328 [Syncephalastrum racemosum]
MVATTHANLSAGRRGSAGTSVSSRSGEYRGRRRSSVRRPSEPRISAAIGTSGSASMRLQQQRRAQSVAAGANALHPPVSADRRRPSAPSRTTSTALSARPPSPPRLSIADQFMGNNFHAPARSPSPAPPLTVTPADERPSASFELDSPRQLASLERPRGSFHSQLSSSSPVSSVPEPGRLTIAEAFSRRPSGAVSIDTPTSPKPEPVHPLESSNYNGNARTSGTFDSQFNLDLTLPSPSSTINGRRFSRPFGSQDTLVQHDRKKSTYSHPMETQKEHEDDPEFSVGDYYVDIHLDNEKERSNYYHDDDRSSITRHGDTMDLEKQKNQEYNHAKKLKQSNTDANDEDEAEGRPRGLWICCCFFSLGPQTKRQQRAILQAQEERRKENGGRQCGRRSWVFGTFIGFILLVVAAYVLWPRTPLMRIEGASLVSPAKITETSQGVMVGNVAFESQWLVNITVDNRQNHVPTKLNRIQVLAKDALTGLVIGKGNDDGTASVLAPDTISTLQLPIHIDYQARDANDATFSSLQKACTTQPPQQTYDARTNQTVVEQPQRESLQLHFWITLGIWGLDAFGYQPTVIATPATGGFACPLS